MAPSLGTGRAPVRSDWFLIRMVFVFMCVSGLDLLLPLRVSVCVCVYS